RAPWNPPDAFAGHSPPLARRAPDEHAPTSPAANVGSHAPGAPARLTGRLDSPARQRRYGRNDAITRIARKARARTAIAGRIRRPLVRSVSTHQHRTR